MKHIISQQFHKPYTYPYLLPQIVSDFEREEKHGLKKIKHAIENVYKVITRCNWSKKACIQSLIERALAALTMSSTDARILRLIEKAYDRYTLLTQYLETKRSDTPSFTRPQLHTIRVHNNETLHKVREIISAWLKDAHERRIIGYSAVSELSLQQKEILDDSYMIINQLDKNCSIKIDSRKSIYVATTDNGEVQAIGCTSVDNHGNISLLDLATRPNNLSVLARKTPAIRGAATAIITHIASDILSNKNSDTVHLSLISLSSSESFYKKLGFVEMNSNFVLHRKGLKELLKRQSPSYGALHELQSNLFSIDDVINTKYYTTR